MLKYFMISTILIACSYSLYSCNSSLGKSFKTVSDLQTLYKANSVNVTSHGYGSVVTVDIEHAKLFDDLSDMSEKERSALLEKYSLQGAQIVYNNMSTNEVPIDSVAISLETYIGESIHGYKTKGWKHKEHK